MYQVNDSVSYGIQGVCKVAEIAKKDFGGTVREYYVLQPVYDQKATIFVPTGNEALTSKMRRVLSEEEIYELIRKMPDQEPFVVEDEGKRRTAYKEIIAGGDCEELIRMIKALHLWQQDLQARGKRLHMAEEHFLKDAEKVLHEEFAHVLDMDRDEVLPFILEQIQTEEQARE